MYRVRLNARGRATKRWRGRRYQRGTVYPVQDIRRFTDMIASGFFESVDTEFRPIGPRGIQRLARSGGHLLVIRDIGVGDVLMVLPALRALKRRHEKLRISLACADAYAPLLQGQPYLESVHGLYGMRGEFDHCVDLRWYAEHHPAAGGTHRAELFAGALGVTPDYGLQLEVADTDLEWAWQVLSGHGWMPSEPLVAVGIRGSTAVRTWDRAATVDLVGMLSEAGVWTVLLDHSAAFGGFGGPKSIDLTGQTSIPRAAAICAWSNCVAGPDSGLVHIAGSLGRPFVGVFTTWAPELRVSQYDGIAISPVRELDCAPCNDGGCPAIWCSVWTAPEEVLRAVVEIIGAEFGIPAPVGDVEVETRNFSRYGEPAARVKQEVRHAKGVACGAAVVPAALVG